MCTIYLHLKNHFEMIFLHFYLFTFILELNVLQKEEPRQVHAQVDLASAVFVS